MNLSRSMTLPINGHITIAWSEDQDEKIKELIEKKLKEGYAFFTVIPAHLGNPQRRVRIEKAGDLGELRNIVIEDADADRLFKEGSIGIIRETTETRPGVVRRAIRRVKDAAEASTTHTIAVRPMRGG